MNWQFLYQHPVYQVFSLHTVHIRWKVTFRNICLKCRCYVNCIRCFSVPGKCFVKPELVALYVDHIYILYLFWIRSTFLYLLVPVTNANRIFTNVSSIYAFHVVLSLRLNSCSLHYMQTVIWYPEEKYAIAPDHGQIC